jgi:hypothetical protein
LGVSLVASWFSASLPVAVALAFSVVAFVVLPWLFRARCVVCGRRFSGGGLWCSRRCWLAARRG